MLRSISFYIKLLLLTFLFVGNLYAVELSIIPQKKPVLDKILKQKNLTQGIIRPKSKPIIKVEKQKLPQEIIKPPSKPSEQANEIIPKVVEKKIKITQILLPKSKPITVKKTSKEKTFLHNMARID